MFSSTENMYPDTEEMWCFNCEYNWFTEDYHNCNSCPNCSKKPTRIYRTSSTSYGYAYYEKHPGIRKKQDEFVKQLNDALDKVKSKFGNKYEYFFKRGSTLDLEKLKDNEFVCASGISGYYILMREKL